MKVFRSTENLINEADFDDLMDLSWIEKEGTSPSGCQDETKSYSDSQDISTSKESHKGLVAKYSSPFYNECSPSFQDDLDSDRQLEKTRISNAITDLEENISVSFHNFINYGNLIKILTKIFTNKLLEEDLSLLSDGEMEIVCFVINRKLFKKKERKISKFPQDTLFEIFHEKGRSRKRREENLRFLVQFLFKVLKRRIATQYSCTGEPVDVDRIFFEIHFLPHVTPENSFEQFRTIKSLQKPMRNQDLMAAFKSPTIKEFFISFATIPDIQQSAIAKEYGESVEKKFVKMFARWSEESTLSFERCKEDIIKYFSSNNQCKLPWTPGEISEAVSSLLDMLEKGGQARK